MSYIQVIDADGNPLIDRDAEAGNIEFERGEGDNNFLMLEE